MEALLWFAYGFVCTSIGLVWGNWRATAQMDKHIQEEFARHQTEMLDMIEEARKEAVKRLKDE